MMGGIPVVKTLLLTDFVNSTRFVETYGDVAAADIFARHDRLARDLLRRFSGQEIDKTDGFLFIFDRPIDAVNYSMAYNDGLRRLSGELGVELSARTGIHLGEVILRENAAQDVARGAKPIELEGLAKPMAARIMSLAVGHQTLMTQSTFELARRAAVGEPNMPPDARWIEHGFYRLKGIAEPVRVFEVGRNGLAALSPPADSEKAKRVPTPGASGAGRLLVVAAIFLALGFAAVVGAGAAIYMGVFSPPAATAPQAKAPTSKPPQESPKAPSQESPVKPPPVAEDKAPEPAETPEAKPEAPTKVALKIVTEPAGARVRLGEKRLEPSPVSFDLPLTPGKYDVKVALKGYQTAKHSCVVTEEDTRTGTSTCTIALVKRRGGGGGAKAAGAGAKKDGGAPPAGGEKKVEERKPKIHMID